MKKKHGGKSMGKKSAKKKAANPQQVSKPSKGPYGDLGRADNPAHSAVSNRADAELAKLMKGRSF